MGFLDNSGDIVLDAVLTDTGRMRLSKGDGSFKITKFALADDEINYAIYNKNHPSGSAYYDIDILQTPVLEAFTNNASSVKHTLTSISRTDLLYLPELLTNVTLDGNVIINPEHGIYCIAVDKNTEDNVDMSSDGILAGENPSTGGHNSYIRVDQGLNTTNISKDYSIDSDLLETQYIVEMDNKLMSLRRPDNVLLEPNFVDDDQIATYLITADAHPSMVSSIEAQAADSDSGHVIQGPRGTCLMLKLKATQDLEASNHLFTKLGGTSNVGSANTACKHIDTILRVHGATTGYSIDVPVRLIKKS